MFNPSKNACGNTADFVSSVGNGPFSVTQEFPETQNHNGDHGDNSVHNPLGAETEAEFDSLSITHKTFLAGCEDKRSTVGSNEIAGNTQQLVCLEMSPYMPSMANSQMALESRYGAEPMIRQASDTFSVSTLVAGDPGDDAMFTTDLNDFPDYEQLDLLGVLRTLDLPTDRRRPAEPSFTGAECRFRLDTPLTLLLTSLGHDVGADLGIVALAAWCSLLSRLSGEDSLAVGIHHIDEKGISADPLPLHVDFSDEPNALQLLQRLKRSIAAARARSAVKGGGATTPHQDSRLTSDQVAFYTHVGGFTQPVNDYVSLRGDLELHLLQDNEDAVFSIHYATDLYNKDTIERFAGYLKAVLVNMLAKGYRPVASFDILSPTERKLLLETWNDSTRDFPSDRCIHQLFEEQVGKSPEAVAIVHGERKITYIELNALADRFACQLVGVGVKQGDYVAMLLQRSVELVTAQLAIFKVGATYVPIDLKAPVERQAFIIKDSAAVLLITDSVTEVHSALKLPQRRLGKSG
ncbi:hypothetical protein BGX28_008786 [Mortierella sp. GBA30]|nr:hypothetical protein BGX28_008786 [Mortierella sp. GBA30]